MDRQIGNTHRIVIKIGSSSLTHKYTGFLNLGKVEKLVRILCDLKNQGMDVVLVSSGAIAVGRQTTGYANRPGSVAEKQALAAIGQARLMMTYQKLFAEYHQNIAQVLLTKDTFLHEESRNNAANTFEELFHMGVIPVVNENDTVATHEIEFGDNDRLSAIVAGLLRADLLVLLSDIDGLYTADPSVDKTAVRIPLVEKLDAHVASMASSHSTSQVGTGGMTAKLIAAEIATDAGCAMAIVNGENVNHITDVLEGRDVGTWFCPHPQADYELIKYLNY